MHPVVANQFEALRTLCRTYHVVRLYLFGSAAAGDFRPGESDLDFLVTCPHMTPGEHYDAYFREEVEQTRCELYAA